MSLKLVFRIWDPETKENVIDEQQIVIDISEEEMKKADVGASEVIAKLRLTEGENRAIDSRLIGRGAYVREIFDGVGITISRFLYLKLADRFGCKT